MAKTFRYVTLLLLLIALFSETLYAQDILQDTLSDISDSVPFENPNSNTDFEIDDSAMFFPTDENSDSESTLSAQEKQEQVILQADRVSFNDETGNAVAQGNAELFYKGTKIEAEQIEYNADTQKIEALSLPDKNVKITYADKVLNGDKLNYDLNSREGVLTGAKTKIGVEDGGTVYVYGGEITVIPWEQAKNQGLVTGTPEDYVVQWKNVVITTCALEHTHYRLETKKITFIPGKRVIAKKPRIYLGNTYLLTSPLDYVVELKRKSVQYSFLPYIQKTDVRGTGGGLTGTLGWSTGRLSLGFSYGGKSGLEWLFELEQELNDKFTLLAGVEYSWDDLWDERQWRPYASLKYENQGWRWLVNWKKNEYISDQKDSYYKYKGRLDRRPEFVVKSPWFRTSKYSWLNLMASYGIYQEQLYRLQEKNNIARYGLGFHSYFEMPLGETQLFTDSIGEAWFYDVDDYDQETIKNFTGLRYKLGNVELGTGYERRYTWGESPMYWDSYRERERLHQKIRFHVGGEIYAALRGSYDLKESMADEIIYSLQWVTDCMTWDLYYTNDRTAEKDNSIGLAIYLNAYPDTPASFGQKRQRDPFLPPSDLPKK